MNSSEGGGTSGRVSLWPALMIVMILAASSAGFASGKPKLALGTARALSNGIFEVPVLFTAGSAGVSALQFDLTLNSSATFVSTSAGAAALEAEKVVTGDLSGSAVRVLVFGLNQADLASGAVAVVRFKPAAGEPTANISISKIIASNGNGASIYVAGGEIHDSPERGKAHKRD